MRLVIERALREPLPSVYAFLADPRNRPRWQSSLTGVTVDGDGPPGLGTRWKERAIGFGTSEMEIVRFEPNRVWAERARSRFGDALVTLYFSPAGPNGEGTLVRLEAEIGIPRLFAPAAKLVMKTLFSNDLAKAEAIIASERAQG
jgi:uncharacterized protein YndB with AHSA1/START domain